MKKLIKVAALAAIGCSTIFTAAHAGFPTRTYVHQYTYYSDASKTIVVGNAFGYCNSNDEEFLNFTGQQTSNFDKEAVGYCDNGMTVYF